MCKWHSGQFGVVGVSGTIFCKYMLVELVTIIIVAADCANSFLALCGSACSIVLISGDVLFSTLYGIICM